MTQVFIIFSMFEEKQLLINRISMHEGHKHDYNDIFKYIFNIIFLNAGPVKPSDDERLLFYAYFKQATEGPNQREKPGLLDVVNRAKWNAWNKLADMTKEEAMQRYLDAFLKV